MHEGPSGTLWFATKGRLFQLDRDTDRLTFLKAAASWWCVPIYAQTNGSS